MSDGRMSPFELAARATAVAQARGRTSSERATNDDDIDDIARLQAVAVDEDALLDAMDQAAEFARAVESRAYDLRVREAARAKVAAENTPEAPAFDAGLLVELLARPAEPPHRVQDLIPTDAAVLVVAMRKTGKTTLLLNLARCLLTGERFLDKFDVRPVTGRVGFLNYEVSASTLATWADEVGVPRDRFYQVNLRGRRNPFAHEDDRTLLAAQLREHQVESLLVDPFGRAYTGQSQNDSGEVGAWLAELDRFARDDAGCTDLVLSAHAGWEGERTRGASALEDWADAIATLTRDKDDETVRYLKATGRDVEVDEDRLHYDHATRHLSLTGQGSRKQATAARAIAELVPEVVAHVRDFPGCSQAAIESNVVGRGKVVRDAITEAVDRGLVARERSGKSWAHSLLVPPRPTSSRTSLETSSPRLYRDEDEVETNRRTDDSRDGTRTDLTLNLSHLPGRCPSCSFHVETQGHRPTCSTRHERTTP